jgi:hypothetical protein
MHEMTILFPYFFSVQIVANLLSLIKVLCVDHTLVILRKIAINLSLSDLDVGKEGVVYPWAGARGFGRRFHCPLEELRSLKS